MFSDVSAECILLACYARYPEKFFDTIEFVDSEDFVNAGFRAIFEAIRSLYLTKEAKKISRAKIISEAKQLGYGNFMSITSNGEHISKVLDQPVDASEFNDYLLKVKRQALRRHYETNLQDALIYNRNTEDSATKIISTIEAKVVQPSFPMDRGRHSIVSITKDAENLITSMADTPGQFGVDLGFPEWQQRVGQVRNGSVTFIAASTKSGKSLCGVHMALAAAYKSGIPVLIADSELNQRDQTVRMTGSLAKIPFDILETGYWKLSEDQLRAAGIEEAEIPLIKEYGQRLRNRDFWDRFGKLPISYLSISSLGIPEVIPLMRRWVLTHVKPDRDSRFPQCLIIYDYIKLAHRDELRGGLQEYQVHGLNINELHDFANDYNLPIIAFGQTNRALDDDINCIAGGKRITENVDSITLWKRKDQDERAIDPAGNIRLKVFEARYGSGTHIGHINVQGDLDRGGFKEIGYSPIDMVAERRSRLAELRRGRNNNNDNDDAD